MILDISENACTVHDFRHFGGCLYSISDHIHILQRPMVDYPVTLSSNFSDACQHETKFLCTTGMVTQFHPHKIMVVPLLLHVGSSCRRCALYVIRDHTSSQEDDQYYSAPLFVTLHVSIRDSLAQLTPLTFDSRDLPHYRTLEKLLQTKSSSKANGSTPLFVTQHCWHYLILSFGSHH